MVAAGVLVDLRRAAEFRRPDDERFFEQSSLLEIRDQGRDRFVDRPTLVGKGFHQIASLGVAMVIPVEVNQLNDAYAALDQTPRQQAIVGKRLLARLHAVHFLNVFGFL